jgi:hypothetical protein
LPQKRRASSRYSSNTAIERQEERFERFERFERPVGPWEPNPCEKKLRVVSERLLKKGYKGYGRKYSGGMQGQSKVDRLADV